MLKTERLILRPWREADLEAFAALNADPRVMEYFPSVKTLQESTQEYNYIKDSIEKLGWGLWAATLIGDDRFIGFIGLNNVGFKSHFTPAVEIGWRLAYDYWNKGYATEGARAVLKYGFEILNLEEIVSFTAVQNQRSRGVMEKIGMTQDVKDDFDHPKLSEGHRLRRHVLYRLGKEQWKRNQIMN